MNSEFWRNFRRRKTKFVDRKQQTRFAIEILVIMLLFPLLFFVLVIIPPFSTIFLGKNAEVLSALFINQLYMIRSVWWVVVFVLVYVALLSVFMSPKDERDLQERLRELSDRKLQSGRTGHRSSS